MLDTRLSTYWAARLIKRCINSKYTHNSQLKSKTLKQVNQYSDCNYYDDQQGWITIEDKDQLDKLIQQKAEKSRGKS